MAIDPMTAAAMAKTAGSLIGLGSKKKTTVKDIPLSKTITAGLDQREKRLKGDTNRMFGETDRAFSEYSRLLPEMRGALDSDLATLDQYRAGGMQEQRFNQGINRYRDALMDSLSDARGQAISQANRRNALLGGGLAMSPFATANLGSTFGMLGRQVATDVEGRKLGNMARFQDIDRGNIGRRMALQQAYGANQLQPLRILGAGNTAVDQMYAGAINNRRNSMDRLIGSKLNTAGKISNALTGVGNTMDSQVLSTAYMNRLDPSGSANSWSSFNPFSRGGGSSVNTWSPKGYADFAGPNP